MAWSHLKDNLPSSLTGYFEGEAGGDLDDPKLTKDILHTLSLIKEEAKFVMPTKTAEMDHLMLFACYLEKGEIYYSPETLRNVGDRPLGGDLKDRQNKLLDALRATGKISDSSLVEALRSLPEVLVKCTKSPEQLATLFCLVRSYMLLVTKQDKVSETGNGVDVSRNMVGY